MQGRMTQNVKTPPTRRPEGLDMTRPVSLWSGCVSQEKITPPSDPSQQPLTSAPFWEFMNGPSTTFAMNRYLQARNLRVSLPRLTGAVVDGCGQPDWLSGVLWTRRQQGSTSALLLGTQTLGALPFS